MTAMIAASSLIASRPKLPRKQHNTPGGPGSGRSDRVFTSGAALWSLPWLPFLETCQSIVGQW
jgi:hypothetical protein